MLWTVTKNRKIEKVSVLLENVFLQIWGSLFNLPTPYMGWSTSYLFIFFHCTPLFTPFHKNFTSTVYIAYTPWKTINNRTCHVENANTSTNIRASAVSRVRADNYLMILFSFQRTKKKNYETYEFDLFSSQQRSYMMEKF